MSNHLENLWKKLSFLDFWHGGVKIFFCILGVEIQNIKINCFYSKRVVVFLFYDQTCKSSMIFFLLKIKIIWGNCQSNTIYVQSNWNWLGLRLAIMYTKKNSSFNPITHGIFDPALRGVWDQLSFNRIMNLYKNRQNPKF